jgi:hypothetical protein
VACWTAAVIGLAKPSVAATQQDSTGSSASTVQLVATPILDEVHLDGHLAEAFWGTADSIWDFRQQEPAEGQPTTERTVVKLVRDHDAFYVGVRAYDSDVSGIRATQLRRDANLDVDDYVLLLIDSFHDKRSGFFFGTNPNGAMWDAQFTGVDDANLDWDGIWNVAVARDSAGWTAEFRIPFRTLRYQAGGDGIFGFNVRRFIRRKN